jgi:predicted HTH transcriptional regulator
MVTHEELMKLIAGGESETVELKASFDKEVIETAGAFANTRGGTVFIGISDAGEIKGAQFGKETLKDTSKRQTKPAAGKLKAMKNLCRFSKNWSCSKMDVRLGRPF